MKKFLKIETNKKSKQKTFIGKLLVFGIFTIFLLGLGFYALAVVPFDADVLPTTDNTYSLGSQIYKFKNAYLSGVLNLGTSATDPAGGVNGSIYYNTTSNEFKGYKNGSWQSLGSSVWNATSTNDIYYNTGNVIVGTTSSTARLTVSNGSIAQNPNNPQLVGSANTGSNPFSVYVSGRYAYMVNLGSYTLQIFDVSNPTSPQSVGSANTGTNPRSVYVSGRYAYVVNYSSNTLQIFDVSNPTSPQSVGSANTGSNPRSVYVSGRYAYVVNQGSYTLQIFDVSNPANPQSVGSANTGSYPCSVYVSGRYAYVVNYGSNTLQIFDVSNPANPQLIGSANTGSYPYSVYVSGRYAYVVNYGSYTLQIFDVSGLETTSAMIHSLEAGNLQVRNDIIAQGQVQISGGLNVGSGGIFSAGSLAVATSSKFVGSVSAGWETVSTTCSGVTSCSTNCSSGKYAMSGGCVWQSAGSNNNSYKSSNTQWTCTASSSQDITTYAICSNIAP